MQGLFGIIGAIGLAAYFVGLGDTQRGLAILYAGLLLYFLGFIAWIIWGGLRDIRDVRRMGYRWSLRRRRWEQRS